MTYYIWIALRVIIITSICVAAFVGAGTIIFQFEKRFGKRAAAIALAVEAAVVAGYVLCEVIQ